jgi:hypothetical protein
LISPPVEVGIGTIQTPKAKLYGWAYPSNHRGKLVNPDTGEIFLFTTNSQGWNDVEHQLKKPSGTVRILFLGDSVTFGGVKFIDLYTHKVESLLKERGFKNVEVISIGIAGWGTDQELEALKVEGIKYSPDIVIYQFSRNDITDILMPCEHTAQGDKSLTKPFKYEIANGVLLKKKLAPKIDEFSPLQNKIKKIMLKSAIIYHLNNLKYRLKIKSTKKHLVKPDYIMDLWNDIDPCHPHFVLAIVNESDEIKKGYLLLETLVLEMKNIAEKKGSRFIIFSKDGEEGQHQFFKTWKIIQTDKDGFDFIIRHGSRYNIDWKRPQKNLVSICRRNNIPLIKPNRSYKTYKLDYHPNVEGNKDMALDIVDFLIKQKEFLRLFGNQAPSTIGYY